jgi:hypothetical protein
MIDDQNQSPFGNYFGSDLTTQDCERIFLQSNLPISLAKTEAGMMRVKWFDYREIHYVKATYLFASLYRRAYQSMTGKVIDSDRAPFVRGFKGDDLFELNPRETKGFWKARYTADRLCIPYDFFIEYAMNWAIDRLWKRFPRPTQLYSKPLLEDMIVAWGERCAASIPLPIDSRFYLQNYAGHDDQDAFQAWLCASISKRANPEFALATHMHINPMISEEAAARYLDADTITRANVFYCRIK